VSGLPLRLPPLALSAVHSWLSLPPVLPVLPVLPPVQPPLTESTVPF